MKNPDEDNIWEPNVYTFLVRSCDAVIQHSKSQGKGIASVLDEIERAITDAKIPEINFAFDEISTTTKDE